MLFNQIIYGPIHSRRFGTSLGVNLSPTDSKTCTFNCVYCECGWNTHNPHPKIPTVQRVSDSLEQTLRTLTTPLDVITFSGNGEPTLHPQFKQVIEATCALRDKYCPQAKITVLTNSTQLYKEDVREALMMVDNRVLKLDSAIQHTMQLIDQPVNHDLTVTTIIDYLKRFDGDFTLQTCFLKGEMNGETIDNTTDEELQAWYQVVEQLRPKQIMIYVIDRQTPLQTLQKIDPTTMNRIATHLREKGFNVLVSC